MSMQGYVKKGFKEAGFGLPSSLSWEQIMGRRIAYAKETVRLMKSPHVFED